MSKHQPQLLLHIKTIEDIMDNGDDDNLYFLEVALKIDMGFRWTLWSGKKNLQPDNKDGLKEEITEAVNFLSLLRANLILFPILIGESIANFIEDEQDAEEIIKYTCSLVRSI